MSNTMPNPNAGRVPEWTVSDRLRKAREAAGLEQIELSNVSGISRSTISSVENGKRPSRATVRLWAMATGVPVGWIEEGEVWVVHPLGLEPRTHCLSVDGEPRGELVSLDAVRAARRPGIVGGEVA